MSFSLGGPRGGQSHALSLSLCCVKVGTWHQIKAGRSGRDGYLELDGQQTIGNAPPGKNKPKAHYMVSTNVVSTKGPSTVMPEGEKIWKCQ